MWLRADDFKANGGPRVAFIRDVGVDCVQTERVFTRRGVSRQVHRNSELKGTACLKIFFRFLGQSDPLVLHGRVVRFEHHAPAHIAAAQVGYSVSYIHLLLSAQLQARTVRWQRYVEYLCHKNLSIDYMLAESVRPAGRL